MREICLFFIKGLKQAGFVVDIASDGEDALDKALAESFDAAIVDIMLPKLDGLTFVNELRKKKVMTPIIFLSAKSSVDDRVIGLQTGGDDYMVKPFAFSELLARIRALIRRANSIAEPASLTAGDLSYVLEEKK